MDLVDLLPIFMIGCLWLLLFFRYPIAIVLSGVGVAFAVIASLIISDSPAWLFFQALPPRIWSGIVELLTPPVIPIFIFAWCMLECSGVVRDFLNCLRVLSGRDVTSVREGNDSTFAIVMRNFIPPVFLTGLVLLLMFSGIATQIVAAGVGAAGAILLAVIRLVILPSLAGDRRRYGSSQSECMLGDTRTGEGIVGNLIHFAQVLMDTVKRFASNTFKLLAIFVGAVVFSFVFRMLGGDDILIELVEPLGLNFWDLEPWQLMVLIFCLPLLVGVAQFIKSIESLSGVIPREMTPETVGGDH